MQALYSLPVLEDLFAHKKYEQALSVLNESVETLGPHLKGRFPADLVTGPEESLVLARLYLVQQEYDLCMRYAYAARDVLHKLSRFYYDAIIYRIMEYLLVHKCAPSDLELYNGLRSFVLDFIREDEPSDSLLGFLAEIGEFALLKEQLILLSRQDVKCEAIVSLVLNEHYEQVSDVFFEMDMTNTYLHQFILDAYITRNREQELRKLLSGLPWHILYRACFYIEDTHQMALTLDNDNANFILSGDWKQEIMSNFMLKNSKTSFKFLESMAKARAPFISLCNSIMNAGTTNDTLYRNNKGMNTGREWVRFLEYSAIGMIHQGNINAFEILKEMLPSFESGNGEPATLMALGLMNAGSLDRECVDFLMNWLDSSSEEVVHGACMGLGLCMMETGDDAVYNRLSALLSVDSTIVQESAIYAIGMIFAGSRDVDVVGFIRSIQAKADFPRVKRVCGLAVGIISVWGEGEVAGLFAKDVKSEGSSTVYRREESDDSGYESVESSSAADGAANGAANFSHTSKSYRKAKQSSKSSRAGAADGHKMAASESATAPSDVVASTAPPTLDAEGLNKCLKHGEAYEKETILISLGTSFVSTGNLTVIKKILPFINDGDDDVKRAAVIAIGLIGYDDMDTIKLCLIPLAENHNPHVRAAVALILGFFTCGRGNQTICSLLEAMMYDSEDLVRQAACMGVGFALVQANPTLITNYKRILDRLNHMIVSKSESVCVKNGAAIGRSIAEVGGRSAIFSLFNFNGNEEVKRVVGALLFFQSWYWYPLMNCLSLCLLPTPVFFFDEKLDETEDVVGNDAKYYDYLVRIPESRKSRKFKASKEGDARDVMTEAPRGLRSGCRMTDMERVELGMECGVIFKEK